MNLLLLNDEILTAETMRDELNWADYGITCVFVAFNAEQAKNLLVQEKIDIALCDIEMPGENGIDLLRWIRRKDMDIECIFLTCHASFEYAQEAVRLGCQDYILMPARYEDIGKAVKKAVQRILQRREMSRLSEYGKSWLTEREQETMQMQGSRKSPTEVVEESINYIRTHLDSENLSVNDVAAHVFLNPIYLNRIFKKEKNISISQFIIHEKMLLAAELIKSGKLTAQAVAAKVGYPSYPHFSATFKKFHGCTPSQYK